MRTNQWTNFWLALIAIAFTGFTITSIVAYTMLIPKLDTFNTNLERLASNVSGIGTSIGYSLQYKTSPYDSFCPTGEFSLSGLVEYTGRGRYSIAKSYKERLDAMNQVKCVVVFNAPVTLMLVSFSEGNMMVDGFPATGKIHTGTYFEFQFTGKSKDLSFYTAEPKK